jgi:hypothetical protein
MLARRIAEAREGAHSPDRVLEWARLVLAPLVAFSPPGCSNGGTCGVVWSQGDTVYHCRTCGIDPSCAICHECFANSDHTGHDYWMFSSGGGCCDCGDVEAWKASGFCSRHPGPRVISLDVHACDELPRAERSVAEAVLDGLCAEYLHHELLGVDDESSREAFCGVDPRRACLRWLTALGSTSEQLRSLVGLCLSTPRSIAGAAVVPAGLLP